MHAYSKKEGVTVRDGILGSVIANAQRLGDIYNYYQRTRNLQGNHVLPTKVLQPIIRTVSRKYSQRNK